MKQQPYEFIKLVKCWQSMPREKSSTPKKSTFSPAKLSSLMPYLFLIECTESGKLQVRLLGSELEKKLELTPGNRLAGTSTHQENNRRIKVSLEPGSKGSNSDPKRRWSDRPSLFDAMMRRDWEFYAMFMQSCGKHPCGGRLYRLLKSSDGLPCEIDSLHVPLADDDGKVRFMLGVMIKRSVQCRQSAAPARSPKEAILNYQYFDLGSGTPASIGVVNPACVPIKHFSPASEALKGDFKKQPTLQGPATILDERLMPNLN